MKDFWATSMWFFIVEVLFKNCRIDILLLITSVSIFHFGSEIITVVCIYIGYVHAYKFFTNFLDDLDSNGVQSYKHNFGTNKRKSFKFWVFEIFFILWLHENSLFTNRILLFFFKFLLASFKSSHSPIQICLKQNLWMKKTLDVCFSMFLH